MPREFRQCWAHSPQGLRCTLRAGHAADHVHKITWADTDATPAPTKAHMSPASIDEPIPFIPAEPPPAGKCVACHHPHPSGECKCGCKSFIG